LRRFWIPIRINREGAADLFKNNVRFLNGLFKFPRVVNDVIGNAELGRRGGLVIQPGPNVVGFEPIAMHRANHLNVKRSVNDYQRTKVVGASGFYEEGRFVASQGFFAEFQASDLDIEGRSNVGVNDSFESFTKPNIVKDNPRELGSIERAFRRQDVTTKLLRYRFYAW
jgi:hypothetical protein